MAGFLAGFLRFAGMDVVVVLVLEVELEVEVEGFLGLVEEEEAG